jgi:hypothetical protein
MSERWKNAVLIALVSTFLLAGCAGQDKQRNPNDTGSGGGGRGGGGTGGMSGGTGG